MNHDDRTKHLEQVRDLLLATTNSMIEEAYDGRIDRGTISRHIQKRLIDHLQKAQLEGDFINSVYDSALKQIEATITPDEPPPDDRELLEDSIDEFDSLSADWQLFAVMDHAHTQAMFAWSIVKRRADGTLTRPTPEQEAQQTVINGIADIVDELNKHIAPTAEAKGMEWTYEIAYNKETNRFEIVHESSSI